MKHQPPEVAARFAQCYVGEVAMSAVTMAELEYGVSCSGENEHRNREALDQLTEDIHPVPFDRAAARAYGPIRLASQSRNRDALDKLIASHAAQEAAPSRTGARTSWQRLRPGLPAKARRRPRRLRTREHEPGRRQQRAERARHVQSTASLAQRLLRLAAPPAQRACDGRRTWCSPRPSARRTRIPMKPTACQECAPSCARPGTSSAANAWPA